MYLFNDTLIDQTLLLGCHNKIMGIILIVNDILQIDSRFGVQIFKEFLIEDKRHAADFFYASFRFRSFVNKIRGDSDGEFASKFFTFKTLEGVSFTVGTDYNIEFELGYRMVRRFKFSTPTIFYEFKKLFKNYLFSFRNRNLGFILFL